MNVKSSTFVPSSLHDVIVENSEFPSYVEPDKFVDSIKLVDTEMGYLGACTGVNQVTVTGGKITAASCAPRQLSIENALFSNSNTSYPAFKYTFNFNIRFPVHKMILNQTSFRGSGHPAPFGAVNAPTLRSMGWTPDLSGVNRRWRSRA